MGDYIVFVTLSSLRFQAPAIASGEDKVTSSLIEGWREIFRCQPP